MAVGTSFSGVVTEAEVSSTIWTVHTDSKWKEVKIFKHHIGVTNAVIVTCAGIHRPQLCGSLPRSAVHKMKLSCPKLYTLFLRPMASQSGEYKGLPPLPPLRALLSTSEPPVAQRSLCDNRSEFNFSLSPVLPSLPCRCCS